MSRAGRIAAETRAAWYAFVRRRTAVFFTFFFPVILILIFGALVGTDPTGGGLFAEPAGYYVAGYLAVVVLFTPLSRVGSEVARHRSGNRFEKLATTPLSRAEWLFAQTLVNVVVIGLASLLILGLVLLVTDAAFTFSLLVVPYVALGVALFCGLGAILGRIADSQDGAIAASNGIAIPLLFLSETFVPPALLPEWFVPLLDLSPLTYFARGLRAATYEPVANTGGTGLVGSDPYLNLVVLAAGAVVFFAAGAYALPRTD
ncbi:ABC-type transport system permease protein [Natronomonas pharaonis DSM 2160]|uniref:ABC-type transport system permease protein n=1 Tax=Natronomonas pharaonis (strain ATCC 35678 / DSM 2160 / CIP 103997 / JCM 8858 / NBRC 14720 / NCIMB 2260 / Gabara) TaxID=348780 RepID=A0A1U7EW62_NATPD|nr:ABC transporter permease [Natronomonas pharaonis]CAI49311.1 ABC-type transport system permease protein [Natronomonas pharaonis DSM 2160]